tara:strand:+ start:3467 stop:3589 length:123 start_codon:yes stop_codon:yes gene_type:complete
VNISGILNIAKLSFITNPDNKNQKMYREIVTNKFVDFFEE